MIAVDVNRGDVSGINESSLKNEKERAMPAPFAASGSKRCRHGTFFFIFQKVGYCYHEVSMAVFSAYCQSTAPGDTFDGDIFTRSITQMQGEVEMVPILKGREDFTRWQNL